MATVDNDATYPQSRPHFLLGLFPCAPVMGGADRRVGRSLKTWVFRAGLGLGLGLGTALTATPPVQSAEEIRVLYGPIQVGISIDSLEAFVEDGTIAPDLAAYTRRLSDEELAVIRKTLQSSVKIEQVALANFLYTTQGEALLGRLGDIIRTRSNSGFYALRASLILAAGEGGGLSPIGFLKAFPTESIVVDADRGFEIVRELNQLTNVTSDALALIETQFNKDIELVSGNTSSQVVPPSQLGGYLWEKTTLAMVDPTRDRTFEVDFYLPNTDTSAPLIVISHGLGSDRTSYRYLAEHLASYGFAVAAPEHPGSNAIYIQALFEGAAEQISEPDEFINRSQDISFMLDELARWSREPYEVGDRIGLSRSDLSQVNLNRVGVIGQSFGGYTALSLGGAEINFHRLEADCPDGAARRDTLNLSLLLQCRAASLQTADKSISGMLNLRDERIKAVIAINPIGSTVFGSEGFSQLEVPVLMVTSSADVIAPTLFEQILPFSWINVQDKYLVLMRQATHFSTIGVSSTPGANVDLPEPIIGPNPQLAQSYIKALSVPFLKSHLSGDTDYEFFLSPTYVNSLSREPLRLSIVNFLNAEQIAQVVKETSFIASTRQ